MTDGGNNLRFEDFLKDRLRDRGFDLKKLSEASGIAAKHLEALSRGNFSSLPPTPYFRGYLQRLGQILDFDSEFWWRKLKESGFVKSSGRTDAMPKNRFITKVNSKVLWISAAVAIVAIYGAFVLPKALGKPDLTISFPVENPIVVEVQEVDLTGIARGASELYINGELVPLNENGTWSKVVLLQSGLNSFEISAKKFLGGERALVQQIIYQASTTTPGIDPYFTQGQSRARRPLESLVATPN